MQMNIRFDSEPDNVTIAESIDALASKKDISTPASYYPNTGERPWSQRRIPLVRMIQRHNVDLFAIEEALVRQVDDVQTILGSQFDHFGVARADNTTDNASGAFDNEFGPLYWNTDSIQLIDADTFWLSNTPFDVGSKAPQAGNPRICTTGHFNTPAGLITAMATHWDDQSDAGREVGASLILHRAKFEAHTTGRPVILFGDFNSVAVNLTITDCNSCTNGAYLIITGASPPLAINSTFLERFPVPDNVANFSMVDFKTVTPGDEQFGHYATFTGFDPYGDTTDMKRIDFIMGGSNGGWISETYGVEESLSDDGLWLSDHRPVHATVTFQPGDFPIV